MIICDVGPTSHLNDILQGIMSLIVREAFEHAPHATYILEGTTTKSRDQYIHLGFEVLLRFSFILPENLNVKFLGYKNLTPIKFGAGKADARGIAASGKDAVGVEIWGMAKVYIYFVPFQSRSKNDS